MLEKLFPTAWYENRFKIADKTLSIGKDVCHSKHQHWAAELIVLYSTFASCATKAFGFAVLSQFHSKAADAHFGNQGCRNDAQLYNYSHTVVLYYNNYEQVPAMQQQQNNINQLEVACKQNH